ncbi:MAG: hypothetical protein ACEPO8_10185 [Rhodothermaceae bacterium]
MKLKEKEFEQVLDELKEVALQVGATVRFEKGDFKGGYCIVKHSKVIVINKRANTQRKVMTLAAALNELGLEGIEISDKLKIVLDEMDVER